MSNPAQGATDEATRVLVHRARSAWQRGAAADALTCCREALALDPDCVGALTLVGVILRGSDAAAAEDALRRARAIAPRDADAAFHLGNLYRERADYLAAIACYESALSEATGHPSLLNNLALALEGAGDSTRAIAFYRQVLAQDARHAKALRNLAHLLCRVHRYAEAAALCERYVHEVDGNDADLWVDYGICLINAMDYERAEAALRRALALAPHDALILTNLGSLLLDAGEYERAEPVLGEAVAGEPQRPYALSLLAYCRQHLCAWADIDDLHARILRAIDEGSDEPINAFAALSMPMSAASQRSVAEHWARDLAGVAIAAPEHRASASRSGERRLRLGYVSSDFGTHPVAFLATEVWERHERARFETYAYAIGLRESSPLRSRIEAAFDHFIDCTHEAAEETAARIRDDGIDILIDLNGYTTYARSEIFALRPAAMQASWLGYLGTLGAPWYDYIITDRFVTPESQQPFFAERFLYLPDCYCPSDTRREIASAPSGRVDCALPGGAFVFCSFNSAYKILPALFDVWMSILTSVARSVLWLAPGSTTAQANLMREAARRGVDPQRLVFAPRLPLAQHLARHAHADLFLDSLPYNAGTTANDALFAGLPVLTCVGETMAGRVAASQLHAIGLSELVTSDAGEYQKLACEMARSPHALSELRQKLARNRPTYPLFDMARFTAALDATLVDAWRALPRG